MPFYLITNRVPHGFAPGPEAFAAWARQAESRTARAGPRARCPPLETTAASRARTRSRKALPTCCRAGWR